MDDILRISERTWKAEPTQETLENLIIHRLRAYEKVVPDQVVRNFALDLIIPTLLDCIEECMGTSFHHHPWQIVGDDKQELLDNLNVNYVVRLNPPHSPIRIRRPIEWQYDVALYLIDDYVKPTSFTGARRVESYLLGNYNDASRCLAYCFRERNKVKHYKKLEDYAAISDEDYFTHVNELLFGFEKITTLPVDGNTVIILHFSPTLAMWADWLG